MEMTPTTKALIARAADQIVRQLSKTPVAELQLTGAAHATPWISVDVRLGRRGGIRYVSAALGMRGGCRVFGAPGLIEAIAKQDAKGAILIVVRIVESAAVRAIAERWKAAGGGETIVPGPIEEKRAG